MLFFIHTSDGMRWLERHAHARRTDMRVHKYGIARIVRCCPLRCRAAPHSQLSESPWKLSSALRPPPGSDGLLLHCNQSKATPPIIGSLNTWWKEPAAHCEPLSSVASHTFFRDPAAMLNVATSAKWIVFSGCWILKDQQDDGPQCFWSPPAVWFQITKNNTTWFICVR